MKHLLKVMPLFFALFFLHSCKKDENSIEMTSIPINATNFINKQFPGKAISNIKKQDLFYPDIDTWNPLNNHISHSSSFLHKNSIYVVTLNGGIRLVFDLNGNYIRKLN